MGEFSLLKPGRRFRNQKKCERQAAITLERFAQAHHTSKTCTEITQVHTLDKTGVILDIFQTRLP